MCKSKIPLTINSEDLDVLDTMLDTLPLNSVQQHALEHILTYCRVQLVDVELLFM